MNREIINRRLYGIFLAHAWFLALSIFFIDKLFFEGKPLEETFKYALKKLEEREGVAKSFFSNSENIIKSIRSSTFFKAYLQTGNQKQALSSLFKVLANTAPNIKSIAYIDKQGLEKLLIKRRAYHTQPFVVNENKLQNKSKTRVFAQSKSLPKWKVGWSAIRPNDITNASSATSKPIKLLDAFLPVYQDHAFSGVIIICFFADHFIENLLNTPLFQMMLFNNEGQLIAANKLADNDLANKKTFLSQYYPKDYQEIQTNTILVKKKFASKHLPLPIADGLNIVIHSPYYANGQYYETSSHYIVVTLIIFLLSIILSRVLVRFMGIKLLNIHRLEKLTNYLNEASRVAKIGFWEFYNKDQSIKWSDGTYDMFGLEKATNTISFDKFLSYLDGREADQLQQTFEDSIAERRDYFLTHKIVTESKEVKYVEERGRHYFDEQGQYFKTIGSVYDVTQRYYAEQRFITLLKSASDGVHIIDLKGRLILWSDSFCQNLGYSDQEVKELVVADWDKYFSKIQIEETLKQLEFSERIFETQHIRKDGSIFDVQIHAKGIKLDGKSYIYASQRDVSVQNKYKRELELIFEMALEGIALIDLAGNFLRANKKYEEIVGYSGNEINEINFLAITAKEDLEKSKKMLAQVIETGEYENFERFCITKSGKKRRFRTSVALMPDKQSYLITTFDCTELYDAFKVIEAQSYLDELTKLANRKAYNQRLKEQIEQFKRYQTPFSLAVIDIDFFKSVNDTYGHSIGDKVLVNLADVVSNNIRDNDYFFRIGGEEFAIVLSNAHLQSAKQFSEKIRRAVEQSVNLIEGKTITVSIGVTEVKQQDDEDSLFKRADDNLYQSKSSGRNKVTAI